MNTLHIMIASKGFLDSRIIPDMAFSQPSHSLPYQFFYFVVSACCSNAAMFFCNSAAREWKQKLGPCLKSPTVQNSLPYLTPSGSYIKSRHELGNPTVCTHDEWFSVMSPGFSNIGLSSLTSQHEVVQAKMLPYMIATNPYYFPMVIELVLVLCLRLSTGHQVHLASDTPIQLTSISH